MIAKLIPVRSRRLWVSFCIMSSCPHVLAATNEASRISMFNVPYLLQVFGSLLLVFSCLFGLVFLLRRMNHLPVNERKPIRVISSVKVGSREKIMLVETGERQILVGVTSGGIRTLYAFGGAVDEESSVPSSSANFASLLQPNPDKDRN